MITVKEIDKVLSQAAPRTLSEEWDNDGVMLCENQNKPVKKVLVMLEVTPDGITAAEKGGYDLIVTHHPFIFRPFKRLTGGDYTNFKRLMQKDIAVLSYHTRFDSAIGGVNDTAAELLGLSLRGYQSYETDQSEPKLKTLIALADYFKVSLDYLVGRSDTK